MLVWMWYELNLYWCGLGGRRLCWCGCDVGWVEESVWVWCGLGGGVGMVWNNVWLCQEAVYVMCIECAVCVHDVSIGELANELCFQIS